MPFNRIYYFFKPYLSWHLRMSARRLLAWRKRKAAQEVWPISPMAGRRPQAWAGWPAGKQFALVLTHDVEGTLGLGKCRQLMKLEKELGFRSSFNFIPEGDYTVPRELREELGEAGFEVGVHDLHHDGRLYRSKKAFFKNSRHINKYLEEWGAQGFRSGFMFRNLHWLHALDIQYDASTFDTDPFEPQPTGAETIFPFWVPRPKSDALVPSRVRDSGSRPPARPPRREGYVELPYTLPQDSTLFLLLREHSPEIWVKKLDWIAAQGGMALVNTHPDYMAFTGSPPREMEYPCHFYERLLQHIQARYFGACWFALPREVAAHVIGTRFALSDPGESKKSGSSSQSALSYQIAPAQSIAAVPALTSRSQ